MSVPVDPDLAPIHDHKGLTWVLGAACGLIVANLYYAQPLTGLIGKALGLAAASNGLLVTLPLAGYGLGLLALVPIGDLHENRRLVLIFLSLEAIGLAALSTLTQPVAFLAAGFFVGMMGAVVQLLVPYVTYLVPEADRGRAVGRVVSGVMLGIMLARPVSSFVADLLSWRAIFLISAVAMGAVLITLRLTLPKRQPAPGLSYPALLRSMVGLFGRTEILQRRAFYHACLFGAFSVFWTAVPLWLAGPPFSLSQRGIALVALAGVAGAVAPPIAGRLADRGIGRWGPGAAIVIAALAFPLTYLAGSGSAAGIGVIIAAAIVLDFAVSANLVFSQRAIYALSATERSRLNGMFMATFFAGGALGSALSGWAFARLGWSGVAVLGMAFPLLALIGLATDRTFRPASAV